MWTLFFWASLALLLYVYFGYPALLAAMGRLRALPESVKLAGGRR